MARMLLGRPNHVRRETRILLAPPRIQLRVGVRDRFARIERELGDEAANGRRSTLDFDERADRRLVERDHAAAALPLLAALLVAEAPLQAEGSQDRVGLGRIRDLGLALLPDLGPALEARRTLVRQDGVAARASQ